MIPRSSRPWTREPRKNDPGNGSSEDWRRTIRRRLIVALVLLAAWALGIEARASSLKTRATPAQAAAIDAALSRLTERGEKGMGELFKVLAVTHKSLQAVPGLPPLSSGF